MMPRYNTRVNSRHIWRSKESMFIAETKGLRLYCISVLITFHIFSQFKTDSKKSHIQVIFRVVAESQKPCIEIQA